MRGHGREQGEERQRLTAEGSVFPSRMPLRTIAHELGTRNTTPPYVPDLELNLMIPLTALLIVALMASNVQAAPAPPDTLTVRVDELITARHFYGIPYEEARALGPEAIPILRSRLHDPKYGGFLPDIGTAICMIGAPEGFPILRAFLWDPKYGKTRSCVTEMVVQSGMGLIAKNSDEALEYLKQSANPAYWDSLPWTCVDGTDTPSLMVDQSITALALTERPEARAHLVKLSESGASEHIRSAAARAVVRFDEIKRVGYAEYERQSRKRRGY